MAIELLRPAYLEIVTKHCAVPSVIYAHLLKRGCNPALAQGLATQTIILAIEQFDKKVAAGGPGYDYSKGEGGLVNYLKKIAKGAYADCVEKEHGGLRWATKTFRDLEDAEATGQLDRHYQRLARQRKPKPTLRKRASVGHNGGPPLDDARPVSKDLADTVAEMQQELTARRYAAFSKYTLVELPETECAQRGIASQKILALGKPEYVDPTKPHLGIRRLVEKYSTTAPFKRDPAFGRGAHESEVRERKKLIHHRPAKGPWEYNKATARRIHASGRVLPREERPTGTELVALLARITGPAPLTMRERMWASTAIGYRPWRGEHYERIIFDRCLTAKSDVERRAEESRVNDPDKIDREHRATSLKNVQRDEAAAKAWKAETDVVALEVEQAEKDNRKAAAGEELSRGVMISGGEDKEPGPTGTIKTEWDQEEYRYVPRGKDKYDGPPLAFTLPDLSEVDWDGTQSVAAMVNANLNPKEQFALERLLRKNTGNPLSTKSQEYNTRAKAASRATKKRALPDIAEADWDPKLSLEDLLRKIKKKAV
jgi:hypothetical protein